MNAKLTLTIDESVIKRAKIYAQHQGKSLSSVIENLLKSVTQKEETVSKDIELSPLIKSLMLRPKVDLPEDYDYKKELEKIRDEKYQKYLNNNEK
ncbi:hypothetical protein IM793_08130 [Pedobacter sp. MR2016-19]|uniref:DUF6364 family protein n=1 Tax=Pedobacter sp. MR2016-19 TaxID=2780089 RepID=UPI000E228580|nr:DUF6364 family protein [Pedobacter sp. MR2016-19]MBE5319121.1 hypothetical protein [Pedobacter sp. MR2016-19]